VWQRPALQHLAAASLLHHDLALYLKSIAQLHTLKLSLKVRVICLGLLLPAWPGLHTGPPPKAGLHSLDADLPKFNTTRLALVRLEGIGEWETLSFPTYLPRTLFSVSIINKFAKYKSGAFD